ncbi:MAG: 1-deoxy-D-xylulose-5-phosphate synthase [Clostridia bacterium]|nr:1-deoxy-D-xylulose-5-phosphate synthase [Clostridia bacterium]
MPENSIEKYKILNRINSPDDLKKVKEEDMEALAAEVREFLIENVSRTGGHLASNLGVVELSLALHRVFSTPKDHIIFDVGHQSYVHKMITGRKDAFSDLRKPGGLSGFEKRAESEHDCFGTGHSSTSLSAAIGIAQADRLKGEKDRFTIAVVGDGAFTGGMIHEALNNCDPRLRLIIILNENEMSISKNIGHFAENLSRLRTTRGYIKTKRLTRRFLSRIPVIGKALSSFFILVKKAVKNAMYKSNYFEDMGLYYIGPIDGNDYSQIESALYNAKEQGENVVIHIKTQKGKGFAPAEADPSGYHSMACSGKTASGSLTFSEVFGRKLTEMAEKDKSICAITAAMCDGTGLCTFKDKHPDRFFDVGIAEPHALTFAAGLAAEGMKPVAAIYSTFLQRGYDNIIHDIALQELPVTLCIDRAGLNGADGATHHGIFDVAFLSEVPGMTIYAPVTANVLEMALEEAVSSGKPAAIRYASGRENSEIVKAFYSDIGIGKLGVRSDIKAEEKPDILIVTYGRIAAEALKAKAELDKEGKKCGIVLLEKLKPYGEAADNLRSYMPKEGGLVLFLEEEIRAGGMGMMLSDEMTRRGMLEGFVYKLLALDDNFAIPEKEETIFETAGVSAEYIIKECR